VSGPISSAGNAQRRQHVVAGERHAAVREQLAIHLVGQTPLDPDVGQPRRCSSPLSQPPSGTGAALEGGDMQAVEVAALPPDVSWTDAAALPASVEAAAAAPAPAAGASAAADRPDGL